MLRRPVELRLRKLEAVLRPRGVFFLIRGREEAEIDRKLDHAQQAREIAVGSIVVRAIWTGYNGAPPSRWIAEGSLGFNHPEHEALFGEVMRRAEGKAEPPEPGPGWRPETRLAEMTDVQLFAKALGELQ